MAEAEIKTPINSPAYRTMLARRFVDIFEGAEKEIKGSGKLQAGMWASEHIPKESREFMKPVIREEFKKRGYSIKSKGDNNYE